jgi:predicted membrane chloride channel (bestrophin family)
VVSKNTIVTILAIIGGIVVLGWVLKLAAKLFFPLLLIGIGVAIYLAVKDNKRIGGPR